MTKEAKTRKETPVFSGVLNYFPDAIQEVAKVSFVGNEQHHPGEKLHWDKSKSTDELDALSRHLIDAGTLDTDGLKHSAKVAWRALANLQREIDREKQEEYEESIIAKSEENENMYPEGYGPCSGHALYSEEMEERMNIIGRNGNDGLHYDVVSGTEAAYEFNIKDAKITIDETKKEED